MKPVKTALVLGALVAAILCCAAAAHASSAGPPYALIFVIDGIPNELFERMLQDGELPNFKEHIYDRGIHSTHHVTVFPPLTFPAMASIFSGRYPSGHNIPNFFWASRNEAAFKNYLSISLFDFERDLGQNCSLLFEYLPHDRTLSFGLPLYIGADHTRNLMDSFIDIFREFRDLDYVDKSLKQERAVGVDMLVKPLKFLSLLNPAKDTNILSLANPLSRSGIVRYTLSSFSQRERYMRRQVPAAVLYYEWATDHFGHEDGPESPDVRDSLIEADTQFGRLVQAYREAGVYEHTYFFLLSDHGQLPAIPEYVRIDRIFAGQCFKTRFISHELIAKSGLSALLRVNALIVGSGSIEGYNCVLGTAGGGSVAAFFSKDGGTDAPSWEQPIFYKDLLNYPVLPDRQINIAEFIISIEAMDFFFVRESEFFVEEPHRTRIVSRQGASLISAYVRNKKPVKLKYEVLEGIDPLGYMQNPALAAFVAQGYHDDREWLRATADTEYPDALVQITQYFESPRSGSVVMIPEGQHTFNSRTWSKHGSLSAGEMLTTFALSGPGVRRGALEYSRTVDFAPTFLHLMGKHISPDNFDGIILNDIFEETERTAQAKQNR